jgi:hypothetical protein
MLSSCVGEYFVVTTRPDSSRFSRVSDPSVIGIVPPVAVPKPTVTTDTRCSMARRASTSMSVSGSKNSPSLRITSARSAPSEAEAESNSTPCRMARATALPGCPTTDGSRFSRNRSIAPSSVVSGVRMYDRPAKAISATRSAGASARSRRISCLTRSSRLGRSSVDSIDAEASTARTTSTPRETARLASIPHRGPANASVASATLNARQSVRHCSSAGGDKAVTAEPRRASRTCR